MSEPAVSIDGQGQPVTASSPPGGESATALASDRPELPVAGAFAGGLLLALVLKRLAK